MMWEILKIQKFALALQIPLKTFLSTPGSSLRSKQIIFVLLPLLFILNLGGIFQNAYAQTAPASVTLPAGSFIINMGVNTQTKPAGLKPYGLVYDLIKNYNVPVYWVINPSKIKEGVDFSHNGVAYRGGTFLIDKQFITPAVASVISQWTGASVVNGKGLVVGANTIEPFTINPTYKFTTVPKWTLDSNNGGIAVPFFTNAGIPTSAYNSKSAASLNSCDDIYVMPHADPKWATHGNLYNWNLTSKGAIWVACHAVSALENMYNPANISEQTNFLATKRSTSGTPGDPVAGSTAYSQNSLLLWGNHNGGTPPYNTVIGSVASGTLASPSDPVAQFIGAPEAATLNGSEQIYLPVSGQGWYASTRIITYDPTQADVPGKSQGPAASIAYGRGLGDNNRGLVMYESGHNINGGSVGDVPAQRAFFNFSFLSTLDKTPVIGAVTGIPANGIIIGTQTYNFSVNATFKVAAPAASYTWTFRRADNGAVVGSFSPNGTSAATSVTFTPPAGITSNIAGIITVKVNDGCGRETFESFAVTLTPGPRPPVATPDNASINTECNTKGQSITISVLANDSDPDGDAIRVTAVTGNNGTWITNGTTVNFSPTANFVGVATATYTVCDAGNLCANAAINVSVGTPDAQGCFPGSIYGLANSVGAVSATPSAPGALGSSDYDPTDVTSYAVVTTGNLVLNMGSFMTTENRKLVISYSSSATSNVTMQIETSTDGITYTNLGTAVANNSATTFEATFNLPAAGMQYVRLIRVSGTTELRIDAVEIDTYGCVANPLTANADQVRTNEDIESVISVLANDNNPGNLPLTVTLTQMPVNGKVSLNPDNTITYLNNRDYSGTDQFKYQICNTQGLCSEATVSVVIEADNCSPGQYKPLNTANPVTITFQNPSTSATDVDDSYLKRDSGGNDNFGNTNTFDIGKTTTKERRGIIRFNTLALPAGAVVTNAVVSVYRTGGENTPYTMNVHRVTESWNEGTVTWLWKTGNPNTWINAGGTIDANVDGIAISTNTVGFKDFTITNLVQAWLTGTPNNGLIIKRENTTLDDKFHTFASSENGTAANRPKLSVTYVMPLSCATIPNRAPLANPDYATTSSVVPVSIPVLANDSDVDLQALTIGNAQVSITAGAGTAIVDPSNSNNIRFTPNPTFNGVAVIRYRISDGSLTDEALVYVTVTNSAPVANRDNATTPSGSAVTINTATNDTDPEGKALTTPVITRNPKKGSASFSGSTLTYTPAPGFYGIDSLIYQISEAVIAGACNQVILSDTALVVIRVTNRAPIAVNDAVTTTRCQPVTINVLANDTDPENGILTVSVATAPAQGTVAVSGTDLIYTPNSGFLGSSVTFTYQICDNASPSLCATATVTVNFSTAANRAPVAVNDNASGFVNEEVYIDVTTNDSDPDNHKLSVSLPASNLKPAYGTVQLFGNNQILYTPNPGFTGTDYFDYTITDVIEVVQGCSQVTPLSATARVTVTITSVGLRITPATYTVTTETRKSAYTTNFIVATVTDPDGPVVSARLINGFVMPEGLSLNNDNGVITVTNKSLLISGTYVLEILTTDINGGESVNRISFTIKDSPLPVSLLTFTGRATKNGNLLEWKTASEKDNARFEVEKSQDGRNFRMIGTIAGSGNSNQVRNYNFTDKEVAAGVAYYRLKQIDQNGGFEYSKVISMQVSVLKLEEATVYPNPTAGNSTLVMNGKSGEAATLMILNTAGQVVYKSVIDLKPGQNQIELPTGNLPIGLYIIKLAGQQNQATLKLQKRFE